MRNSPTPTLDDYSYVDHSTSQNKRIKNTNSQINCGEQPQSSSTMPLNSTSSRQQEIQDPNVFSFFQSNNDRGIVSSLSDIIQQYESQPGLLKMILLSKVEEDRRKTEEVKLRQKELDYMIANQSLKGPDDTIDNNIKQEFDVSKSLTKDDVLTSNLALCSVSYDPFAERIADSRETSKVPNQEALAHTSLPYSAITNPTPKIQSIYPNTVPHHSQLRERFDSRTRSYSLLPIPTHQRPLPSCSTQVRTPFIQQSHNYNNSLFPARKSSCSSQQTLLLTSYPTHRDSNDAIYQHELLASTKSSLVDSVEDCSSNDLTNNCHENVNINNLNSNLINDAQSPNTIDSQRFLKPKVHAKPTSLASSSVANDSSINQLSTIKKRRKRDVQAITMIVQTKEFPYNDQHEWKNNGNT
ncbi:hypothetical protein G6F15_006328 [Rhizopus arrhizus]|nr:hypothetical protein G6F15_006328 [Rhizopus arrhizus]KAG1132073.1 hypothetical protein G6F42_002671 [Rhizopus arrhizus]